MKEQKLDVDEEAATSLSVVDTSDDPSISDRERGFLSLFSCPITKQILQDPVVLSDGISYDRSAVQDRNETIMYPNRALKSTMADINISTSTIIISKPTLLQQAKRFVTAQEERPLPEAFYCPITLSLMHQPVIDPQGCTYEKVAIYKWIEVNGDSPVTREALTVDQLIPNHALEGLLLLEASRDDDDDIHPAILKWKKESAVLAEDMSIVTVPTANNVNASATATVNNNTSDTSTRQVVGIVGSFPTTPEELQAQLQDARRRQIQKRLCRLAVIILLILVIVVGFFIPILAAIALVILIFSVCCAMSSSLGSDGL
jgi:hypothetical protein